MKQVVIIGSAHPLRGGGIASFNERLARAFLQAGHPTTIYTFSLQYPSFLFPGTSQYSSEPAPEDLDIRVRINSINPLNWISVGLELRKRRPDIIVVRYWIPFLGPCLGTLLRLVRGNRHTRIICLADNIIPHEKRPGDRLFTRYFLQPVHAFVTMSRQVLNDLRQFTQKPAILTVHPLYDNFGAAVPKAEARQHLGLDSGEQIILFFGFIRKYKGLDLLLEAMQLLQQRGQAIKLLVAGEFYGDEASYQQQVDALGIRSNLLLHTHFISDSEVKYYLCAADFVIQPYRSATQSGVTPLAYYFEKPMLVTNVGGLPGLVPHGKAGLVTEPDAVSVANGIEELYRLGEAHFRTYLQEEKRKYSWEVLVQAIEDLAAGKQPAEPGPQ
jgi:glycosyltransferase involved in cell wall biosynthesis